MKFKSFEADDLGKLIQQVNAFAQQGGQIRVKSFDFKVLPYKSNYFMFFAVLSYDDFNV